MEKLDLLLINPSNRRQMYGALGSSLSAVEPPFWTALLASFIRERGFSVKIIDADAEGWSPEYAAEKIVDLNPLLVGIAVIGANPSASSTPKMPAASRVLNSLKNKSTSIKTFIYGIHPSALPERTLREEPVDFVCRGECFYAILNLLQMLKSNTNMEDYKIEGLWYKKNGQIISNGWGVCIENIDVLPFVAWDLLPMDKYRAHNWHCFSHIEERKPYAVIHTSLGCPFSCKFCNIHVLYSGKSGIRFRSPKKVVKEIDLLVQNYNVKNIKIIDEMFTLKEDRTVQICDLITQRGYDLNIWAYARIDTVNEAVLRKMKQAGINWLAYGIESGNKSVREGVNKGRFDQDKIRKAIEMTHGVGIHVVGNFIFGLPGDDLQSMQETLNLAKELNCEYANFYVAMAYPGSQLYENVTKEGANLPDNWLSYSQLGEETIPLSTEYLSSADVLCFRDEAFQEYYTNPQYVKMIEQKFDPKVVNHIREMLKYKIDRKLLETRR